MNEHVIHVYVHVSRFDQVVERYLLLANDGVRVLDVMFLLFYFSRLVVYAQFVQVFNAFLHFMANMAIHPLLRTITITKSHVQSVSYTLLLFS